MLDNGLWKTPGGRRRGERPLSSRNEGKYAGATDRSRYKRGFCLGGKALEKLELALTSLSP